MNPASSSRPGGRAASDGARQADVGKRSTSSEVTPDTDMQDEDAGTAASGNSPRPTAAQTAMKQEHKTQDEGGSRR